MNNNNNEQDGTMSVDHDDDAFYDTNETIIDTSNETVDEPSNKISDNVNGNDITTIATVATNTAAATATTFDAVEENEGVGVSCKDMLIDIAEWWTHVRLDQTTPNTKFDEDMDDIFPLISPVEVTMPLFHRFRVLAFWQEFLTQLNLDFDDDDNNDSSTFDELQEKLLVVRASFEKVTQQTPELGAQYEGVVQLFRFHAALISLYKFVTKMENDDDEEQLVDACALAAAKDVFRSAFNDESEILNELLEMSKLTKPSLLKAKIEEIVNISDDEQTSKTSYAYIQSRVQSLLKAWCATLPMPELVRIGYRGIGAEKQQQLSSSTNQGDDETRAVASENNENENDNTNNPRSENENQAEEQADGKKDIDNNNSTTINDDKEAETEELRIPAATAAAAIASAPTRQPTKAGRSKKTRIYSELSFDAEEEQRETPVKRIKVRHDPRRRRASAPEQRRLRSSRRSQPGRSASSAQRIAAAFPSDDEFSDSRDNEEQGGCFSSASSGSEWDGVDEDIRRRYRKQQKSHRSNSSHYSYHRGRIVTTSYHSSPGRRQVGSPSSLVRTHATSKVHGDNAGDHRRLRYMDVEHAEEQPRQKSAQRSRLLLEQRQEAEESDSDEEFYSPPIEDERKPAAAAAAAQSENEAFTQDEADALVEGINTYGFGKWPLIKLGIGKRLANRSVGQIKDFALVIQGKGLV